MSAVNSWRKLKKLSWSELRLLVRSLMLLPLTAVCIKLFGFRRLYAAIAFTKKNWYHLEPIKKDIYVITRMVSLASNRGLYRPNCLQKSLVLWWLLRCQGIESDLRIGVRKQDGSLEAHAWVEYEGDVLNDSSDVKERFAPFAGAILPLKEQAL
ncbi:lasso peptide biosynthesis B2 protein [Argonema antarcticum]|uniref:lasso peptide biosynthesis B2 protein n=1 Tax=Argonema antarcticum TaxID=2942763 RepID=UPI0020135783|nr:lasso peptide biosynthesis B2 protein [Argonema antarcticum]MCL1472309.1 lasso peptide biosynthesis B2 protein [Argonema antarcticum A004/B2]